MMPFGLPAYTLRILFQNGKTEVTGDEHRTWDEIYTEATKILQGLDVKSVMICEVVPIRAIHN